MAGFGPPHRGPRPGHRPQHAHHPLCRACCERAWLCVERRVQEPRRGEHLEAVNTSLPPNGTVSALAIDPSTPTTLYAGTNDGVFAITFEGLTLRLRLNQPTFQTGNQLSLTAEVIPGLTPVTVDVYIALQPPGCTSFACLLFWQGGFNFTTTPQPLLRNWRLSPFTGPIFTYTFGGTEPVGSYVWLGAFVGPGTLTLVGEVTQASFTFYP